MWRAGVACIALVGVAACGGEPVPPPVDLSCDGQPDPHCGHPIDRALVPRLRALGVPIRDAAAEELCRRMAIDLIGRGPTPVELALCRSQTPSEMFDRFAAGTEYLREQRRAWGELFEYDVKDVWSVEIYDLDRLVNLTYAGALDYAGFAAQAAVHPAFHALHPGDSWTAQVWSIFLGRPARPDELEAMRPLTRAWASRAVCDGAVWWNFYTAARQRGAFEVQAVLEGHQACWDVPKIEWGFNPCACLPGPFSTGCTGDALGRRVELTAACVNPADHHDPANFVRASDRSPGDHKCPDGTPRPECKDRLIDPDARGTFQPLAPWAPPPAQLRAELGGLGTALAARGDFWEAAVDRELRKLLGWWQVTFHQPDSDLPEIRALLAEELRTGGTLRALQRRIATSLLYTQPGAAPDVPEGGGGDGAAAAALPPWAAGPTKLLAGEAWLVTAAAAVGEQAGRCDFRWVSAGRYAPFWADPRQVEPPGGTLDARTRDGYSIDAISRLSGCTSEARRPRLSNIGLAYSQEDIAHTLCAYGTGVVPPGYAGDHAAALRYLIERIWARSPDPAELVQLVADMNACVVAPLPTGCGAPEIAVRWMCHRMIDSAEFTTY